jgi:hypothetical protein
MAGGNRRSGRGFSGLADGKGDGYLVAGEPFFNGVALDSDEAGRLAAAAAAAAATTEPQQDCAIEGVFCAASISDLSWLRLSLGTMVRALLRASSPWRAFWAA